MGGIGSCGTTTVPTCLRIAKRMECCHPSRFGASNARDQQTCWKSDRSAIIRWLGSERFRLVDGESEDVMNLRSVMVGALVIVAVLQPACLELETTNGSGANGGTGGSGTGGTASTSSSGGGASCSASSNSCDDCRACSTTSPLGKCNEEYQDCVNSMECVLLADCVRACPPGIFSCWEACFTMHPDGVNLYGDYNICVYCMECDKPCADAKLCLD